MRRVLPTFTDYGVDRRIRDHHFDTVEVGKTNMVGGRHQDSASHCDSKGRGPDLNDFASLFKLGKPSSNSHRSAPRSETSLGGTFHEESAGGETDVMVLGRSVDRDVVGADMGNLASHGEARHQSRHGVSATRHFLGYPSEVPVPQPSLLSLGLEDLSFGSKLCSGSLTEFPSQFAEFIIFPINHRCLRRAPLSTA